MEKILVAIDFSDLATQVIDHAAMQATLLVANIDCTVEHLSALTEY
jgi:hypothetical protein